jgi:hypothetical protein
MAHESIAVPESASAPSPPVGAALLGAVTRIREAQPSGRSPGRAVTKVREAQGSEAQGRGSSPAAAGDTVRRRILLRLLPSITDIVFLLPLYFIFVKQGGAPALLQDAGTALHILTGDWILAHHAVPHLDLYSFTKAGSPWCAWEWAWDVLVALIHRRFGLSGVVVANCLVLSLLFALLFRLIRRRTGHSLLAFSLTLLAVETSCFHWLARPHLSGWLFVILTLTLIERSRQGDRFALWLIPPLVLLWANLHGSFFIAPLLLAAYAIGELLDILISGDAPSTSGDTRSRGERLGAALRYGVAGTAALGASLVNPYGWKLHFHIVQYLFDSRLLERIKEFQSTDFHHPPARAIELLLLLGALAAVWSVARREWGEAIAILVFAHFALISMRNVPVFAFIACGAIGASLAGAGRQISRRSLVSAWLARLVDGALGWGKEIEAMERVERLHWPAALAIVMIALLFRAPVKPAGFQAEFDPRIFPVNAVAVMARAPVGRVFTSDQWGDYLLYRFYPKVRVFLDDRSDFYGADFDDVAIRIATAQYDWRDLLAKYDVDTALLSPNDPLTAVLKISPEWRLMFADGVALLFRREVVQCQGLTEGHNCAD